jgi:hypothetical protein
MTCSETNGGLVHRGERDDSLEWLGDRGLMKKVLEGKVKEKTEHAP